MRSFAVPAAEGSSTEKVDFQESVRETPSISPLMSFAICAPSGLATVMSLPALPITLKTSVLKDS